MQSFEMPDFYVPWPARKNSNLEAARSHSKTWAQEMGILGASQDENSASIWTEHDFDRHDYALLCAYIHPETPIPELNLMTDWNVWAFYVDDYFLHTYKQSKDYKGAKEYLDRVLLFMPINLSPLPTPTNPTEQGLADLWQRTAPSKSEAWRGRIIENTRSLLEAFLWELDNLGQQRLANPIEYIEMRRQVGAALWSADLVEHAMFVEIPERIAETRPMQVLKNTFADAVHLRNDIFSYDREVIKQGELTNAVLVVERFLGVDAQCAANLTNDLLTSRLQQFEHTTISELIPLFDEYQLNPLEQAHVLNYIRGLQDWQSGAHEWHIQTSRYLNPSNVKPSNAEQFLANLTGFGTSSMRITPDGLGLNRFKNYARVPYQKVGQSQWPEFYMPFASEPNPNLEAARQYSKAWVRKMGMLDTLPNHPDVFIWDEQRFDVADYAFFSALAHSKANAVEFNQYVCWLIWGIYTDDYFAMIYGQPRNIAGAKMFIGRLLEFMPLEMVSPASIPLNPVEKGLADLWSTIAKTLSHDEQVLFRHLICDLIGSWVWELCNQIQNRIPDLVDYIEMRRKTSAAYFMLRFIRLVQGKDIPDEIYATLTISELNNITMDYAGLNNDIVSHQKEIEFEGDMHNAVLVIENFIGCDRMQAIHIVNNLTTARIKQFEHIVDTELPILFENHDLDTKVRENLLEYVGELKHFIFAAFRWHTISGRYKEIEFGRSARSFANFLTKLGTTSTRIQNAIGSGNVEAASPSLAQDGALGALPKDLKIFAVSHLGPPFPMKKEEAETD